MTSIAASPKSVGGGPAQLGTAAAENVGFPLTLVYLMWTLLLFEPEWFLSAFGGGVVLKRIPTLLLLPLLLVILQHGRSRALYWPFALFVGLHMAALPFVENRGLAMGAFKHLYHIFFVFFATASLLDSPSRATVLVRMFFLSFLWYGLQGIPSGKVFWHSELGNEDSYGPFMVMGVGFTYYYAMGVQARKWRLLGLFTAGLCLVGVIASFARGAVLSLAVVLVLMWLRSPNKVKTAAAGIAAGLMGLVAIEVIHPRGAFWAEMETISQGTEESTASSRWTLWQMGLSVFSHYPIFGVGANHFGVAATEIVPTDERRENYSDASVLYHRKLHNIYVQMLCEEGLVGVLIYVLLLLDFRRRLLLIRSPEFAEPWNRAVGGQLDVRCISFGLEVAMVGFLATGFFYNQIYIHWFWTLVSIAFVLSQMYGTPALEREPEAAAS